MIREASDRIRAYELLTCCVIGGALGWKTKGSLDPKFEEVAFALETSTTNSPKFVEVKTEFGYHIIMVEGRK
jgi:NIMA-interacting peptidyl-prolyl cis-trans isomerase 4